MQVKPKASSV